jgi:hypothetical protein
MEMTKAQNMLDHEEEIMARPPRTWFQTETQKREVGPFGAATDRWLRPPSLWGWGGGLWAGPGQTPGQWPGPQATATYYNWRRAPLITPPPPCMASLFLFQTGPEAIQAGS